MLTLTALVAALGASSARAQSVNLPIPVSSQFDVTGFIQAATLDSTCTANPHCGGTVTVNGITYTVPKETMVILPANALTWQEIFAQAPAPWGLAAAGGPMSGLALADVPKPIVAYEAHLTGNMVNGTPMTGLVSISQQSLNSGAGYITAIDYTTGALKVGSSVNDPNSVRVIFNDPVGRYGRAQSPDPRFTVDTDNPTIIAGTAFPMCVPRVTADPNVAGNPDDALCPLSQRPKSGGAFLMTIQTNDPTNAALIGVPPVPTVQAPMEVGDYVTFSGTLALDAAGLPYVSAHTVVNNTAIFTWPGTDPAYVAIDTSLIGTGGLTVLGAGEATIRTRFEGVSTDPGRRVHLYGLDYDPLTGAVTDRDFGYVGVDPGPPTGAVKGRWRFRPPCLAAGTVATKPDKQCVMNAAGTFLPPPREVRAVIESFDSTTGATIATAWSPGQTRTAANGLIWGQYHAPIAEYIFPENIPGTPVPPANFESIPFLAQGGYSSSAGTITHQLSPWPGDPATAPAPACVPPTALPGGPYTVPTAGTVTLAGGSSGTTPVTLAWSAPSGTFSDPTIANPVYTAPANNTTSVLSVQLTLTATNGCGTSAVATTVSVNPPKTPTINAVSPVSVFSGGAVSIPVSGTDPNNKKLTFTVTQTGTLLLSNLKASSSSTTTNGTVMTSTSTITATAPTLPLGQVTPSVVTLTINATDGTTASPTPVTTTVTVNPLPDAIAISIAQYRTGKQRLDLTASSSVISPNVVLKLNPYMTTSGTIFDPSTLGNTFTNTGAGTYTLTLVGCPEPAVPPATPLTVSSNLGGTSPATALTNIRQ